MTKTELLRTIEILFWEQSFSDLSMDAIARKLGMKKPSLYYHFPSKEAMFFAVVETSFETYQSFLVSTLHDEDILDMLSKLILFPYRERNLFAVASQKGYCQIEEIHRFISEKSEEIRTMISGICTERFSWSPIRTFVFLATIDALAKRCSIEQCENKNLQEVVVEIQALFFNQ